ncbi:MAG: ribosome hibernation-promoting factor, HPF/YfiA family [Verrucomicrobiales bacterium]
MQTANVNPPVKVTCRHIELTEALRDYAGKKIEGLHLDYPRIIEARVVLDVEKSRRQTAEIILFCANHITIQAKTTHEDLYAAIDETISKIARRMRKHKTRLLKRSRPRNISIRHLTEQVFEEGMLEDAAAEVAAGHHEPDIEPSRVHEEPYSVRPLYRDEALLELEMSDASFIVFTNAASGHLSILYRRGDGEFGLIEPSAS